MNGLRIYTRTEPASSTQTEAVFYTRRGSGPYYRWGYDEGLAVWRPSRLSAADLMTQSFDQARWKSIPSSLKSRLNEHYLE